MSRFSTVHEALSSDRMVTLAHRGASSYAPENTLPSFDLAIQHGVDFLELDVTLSSDGELVVIHDPDVDRTSNGTGAVLDLTLGQLRTLDFGAGFSQEFRDTRIPVLQEVLRLAKDRCLLDIELKIDTKRPHLCTDTPRRPIDGSQCTRLVDTVVRAIDDFDMCDQVLLSGFSREALSTVKSRYPRVVCGLAIAEKDIRNSVSFAGEGEMELVFPQVHSGTREYLSFVHSLGLKVFICVFDAHRDVVRDLASAGVDGIMANNPDILQGILSRVSKS
ncbi:MAG: glycerophosphodiester phosphodiesterase family protein [Spirochaetes bacterium]|nr:glycerophosphodiester phosphodiesterase family protein [Spirochaetota bacterium]